MAKFSVSDVIVKAELCVLKGDIHKAKRLYGVILEKFPNHKRAKNGLASIHATNLPSNDEIFSLLHLMKQQKFEDAAIRAINLTKKYPNFELFWNALGTASINLNCHERAVTAFKKVTELNSKSHEAFNNLGVALHGLRQLEDAAKAYHEATCIDTSYSAAFFNLGNVLRDLKRFEEAIQNYNFCLNIEPNHLEALNNLANVLCEMGELEKAVAYYRKAIDLAPNNYKTYNNLGTTLIRLRRLVEAETAFLEAIKLNALESEAKYNLGMLHWLKEDFIKAFDLLEWRSFGRHNPIAKYSRFGKPRWNGEKKLRLCVWKEQGLGDEIMFASTLSELTELSEKVLVECDPRLKNIYQRSFSGNIKFFDNKNTISDDTYDVEIPIGSLPRHLRKHSNDFKRSANSWLKADETKVLDFRQKLNGDINDKIIGLSWFTKSTLSNALNRNLDVEMLAKYLKKLPVKFVSLQYGDISSDILRFKSEYGLEVTQVNWLDPYNDIDGLASLIAACDTVISCSNVTAHLSGALGVDTRVLLPFDAGERWGLSQRTSYWYNSVTLYRQSKFRDWSEPFHKLETDLISIFE